VTLKALFQPEKINFLLELGERSTKVHNFINFPQSPYFIGTARDQITKTLLDISLLYSLNCINVGKSGKKWELVDRKRSHNNKTEYV